MKSKKENHCFIKLRAKQWYPRIFLFVLANMKKSSDMVQIECAIPLHKIPIYKEDFVNDSWYFGIWKI